MSYVKPSVLVYEEIVNSGGTNPNVPQLPPIVVGPAYNVLTYIPGDPVAAASLLAGVLTDPLVDNTFSLPSQIPGQVVDPSTFQVWASQATCETYSASATVSAGSNVVSSISGQTPFTALMPNGQPQLQPGFTVVATYSNGSSATTSVLSVANASGGVFTTADIFPSGGTVSLVVTSQFDDIQLTASEINTANVGVDGTFIVLPEPSTPYGTLVKGNIYCAYSALRTDLAGKLLTFNTINDLEGQLGQAAVINRLFLGVQSALANSGPFPVYGIAVASDDLDGYTAALEALENQFVYTLVPLTQQEDIIAAFQAHVNSMSQPQFGEWRVVACNTQIATSTDIGMYGPTNPNTGATLAPNTSGTGYILTATNATFISDGVDPSDVVVALTGEVGNYIVQEVVSNQQLIVSGVSAPATGVDYYITRNLSRTQMAANVAGISTTFNDSRVWHIQPDIVSVPVGTVNEWLPGYYLAAAVAGQVAALPVQQGLTNLDIAGINDLQHSNFFFTRTQLDTMAGAGTCLYVQKSQGSLPYCRHELTTNMATVNNQEIMITKDLDALAYYFRSLLAPFIGQWNVVPETINIIHQTLTAGALQMQNQKLPQLGAPLLSHQITSIQQDPNSLDSIDVTMVLELAYPNNYVNLYLQV